VSTRSRTTASVAGPRPRTPASATDCSIGERSSVPRARTAADAPAYARTLNELSPLSSRYDAICDSTCAAVRESMASSRLRPPSLSGEARVVPQLVDALVELSFGELDFLPRPFLVEQAAVHRDRDLVQIADLHENVVGDPAQADVLPLLGKRASLSGP